MLAAAAVLPSVYTLSSGAQTANASNLRCWSSNVPTTPPDRFTLAPDGWLRKQVHQGNYKGAAAYCVVWDQTVCVDQLKPSFAADGTVWLVNDVRVIADRGALINQMNINNVSQTAQVLALVYVDQFGAIATLDPEPGQNVRPVRETCWTSLIGSATSPLA